MATKTGPQITIARKSGAVALAKRMAGLTKLAAYVGVPAAGKNAREKQLLHMANTVNSGKRKARLNKAAASAAASDVTNAELLFIHTNGSQLRHIPARPVIQPAIALPENKKAISNEISASVKANLSGDKELASKKMMRAALAGQNAARKFFTDPRNNWAPNAPSTIAAKGSDRPLIDTGALRAAIVGVVREE